MQVERTIHIAFGDREVIVQVDAWLSRPEPMTWGYPGYPGTLDVHSCKVLAFGRFDRGHTLADKVVLDRLQAIPVELYEMTEGVSV